MKSSKVRDNNFVTIQGWMITKLGLKGNALIVYAIIYGFSQDGRTHFTGSLQYLADWTSTTKPGVHKILRSLVNKGFIRKKDKLINNVKFCEYYVTPLSELKGVNSSERGIKPGLTNNIDNNIDNNIGDTTDVVVEPNLVNIAEQTTDGGGFAKVTQFYQDNFGMLSSYLYDDIRQTYDDWKQKSKEPVEIMIKAMQIALEKNVRNWRFVSKVLLNWDDRNPQTLADVEALEKEHGRQGQQKKTLVEQTEEDRKFNETYGYFADD